MATKAVKTEKKAKPVKAPKAVVATAVKSSVLAAGSKMVILNPRITEKATMQAEQSIYTFNVAVNATKSEVEKAVKELFKVTPKKVRMVTIHARKVVVRGKRGTHAGGKKALVYLKKGDKISFV